jgi:pyruvate/2-oxoglutarate dehydrogenase complex dihydrolipoamide dehydrogenase (E3) component
MLLVGRVACESSSMETEDVDVVVVGLGPGGEHAAIRLGRAGFDVVAVENRLVGGECPYYGCVPTKMMIAAARVVADARRVPGGGTSHIRPDWSRVARRVREEATDDWDDKVAVERLTDSSVTFVRDTARLAGPGRVEVGGTTYVASRGVVLNTGTAPAAPSIDGLEDTPYWTNREAVSLTELPNSIVVLGGGAIGCEFAQIFRRFGVAVTVVEAAERLLALEEPEASALLQKAFVAEGIEVFTGAKIAAVRHRDDMFSLNLGDRQVTADKLLVAAGRRPNLAGIGLETVGLDPEAAAVETDERLRAGEKLWAVGDITGKGAYTTCRCTKPPSWCTTSWARTARRPTTGPSAGWPSPTPRSPRSA